MLSIITQYSSCKFKGYSTLLYQVLWFGRINFVFACLGCSHPRFCKIALICKMSLLVLQVSTRFSESKSYPSKDGEALPNRIPSCKTDPGPTEPLRQSSV
jgi:hypothetical protein